MLGVSWGRTLNDIAAPPSRRLVLRHHVVQVNGGVSMSQRRHGGRHGGQHRPEGGGAAALLPSPAILEHPATKGAIEADRVVARVLEPRDPPTRTSTAPVRPITAPCSSTAAT